MCETTAKAKASGLAGRPVLNAAAADVSGARFHFSLKAPIRARGMIGVLNNNVLRCFRPRRRGKVIYTVIDPVG